MRSPLSLVKFTLLLAGSALLAACASEGHRPGQIDLIDAALEESLEHNAALADGTPAAQPGMDIDAALLPRINLEVRPAPQVPTENRFDLQVNRAPARQFFMQLVEGTPYNMVVHPKVKGRITLDLKNVTVPQVMETVRDVFGYDFEYRNGAYHVFPDVMRTRIFKINYLDIVRRGQSNMRVSSGQVTENYTDAQDPTATGSTGTGTTVTPSSQRTAVPGSQIQTASESDFWTDLYAAVSAIIGNGEGRSVVVSPQSGLVVVRALTSELRSVAAYLETTQKVVQRQVILEAKILEVELRDGYQAGINWAGLVGGATDNLILGQTGGGSLFDNGSSIIDGNTGNLNPLSPTAVDGTATSAFGGVFTAAVNIAGDFTAFIELLKSQGDVQVLSSPRVSTVNNQKAVIKVGTDEFFITDILSNTNTGAATTTIQNNVELTPFFSGVALDVIPQISEDGDIILHIHPTVSSVIEKIKDIGLSTTTTLSVPLAVSSIRESDSIVRARNGQVIVIGGLMQNTVLEDTASIPGLGDVPVVGGLFRQRRESIRKSELVILLRPIIVDDSGRQWSEQIRQARRNIRSLGAPVPPTAPAAE